jgi:hypothetical protein
MKLLINFFECGNVIQRSNLDCCDFYIQDISKINSKVIPHFIDYPLYNIKNLDFLDYKKALEIYNTENRKDSLIKIKKIISNMNSNRKFN